MPDYQLPHASFRLDAVGQDLVGPSWSSGWDDEDIDGDGQPGVTIRVKAPLCGGKLFVASETSSKAQATWSAGQLEGDIQVVVQQEILGATGPCLKLAASDSVDHMQGQFRYAPVPEGTTCDSLPRSAWPSVP